MVGSVLVGMLCAHLLCFAVMFLLISKRLQGKKMGMDFFAMGNLLLGLAYVLQLVEGGPAWSMMSVVNHTLTLAAPITYGLGVMRFLGFPAPLWRPLAAFVLAYSTAQALIQWSLGPVARYAMLSGMSALLFLVMTLAALYGVRTFAKHLYREMAFFALLISGICILNAIKFIRLLQGGLEVLHMDSSFQMVFYIYMSSLATVVPPFMIWLVFRRLTDDLSQMAARDPMTQLLNRRGLSEALEQHFNLHNVAPAYLLLLDVDHFKRINDTYGHQAGDTVLRHVADVLRTTVRRGDLTGRIGGEEFVAVCLDSDDVGVVQLAERLRAAVEEQAIHVSGHDKPLHCTVTIGVSPRFANGHALEKALRAADVALYQGKAAGRNRIEKAHAFAHIAPLPGAGASATT
ncbi:MULTISPECIES: GGDEF domain-containing protein [Acidovorax]|uniref:diguanylate cyclase n=1 Tax=Acidovorax facilis TaxID=12917 RepID=A0ABV8DL31_9BURK|nr:MULTISPECIES: GGDEF domain-containing protein [Acidovorax]KQB58957.1 diguanylate cyclase [Acidovorax sp. SD340]MBO1006558.1 GGDEF domain-containing protein [Acidovorax sp. SD340]MCO4240199.1 GGDEF domain-containing protein [Acidovorax facilis]